MNIRSLKSSLLITLTFGVCFLVTVLWALRPNSSVFAADVTVSSSIDETVDTAWQLPDSLLQVSQIVSDTAPVVDFDINARSGLIPFTAIFTNTSQFADSYVWNYGDGVTATTSALVHSHVYTAPGEYSVTLIGTNNFGSAVKYNYIYTVDLPIVYFEARPRQGLISLTTTFISYSQFADSYLWNYGDGTTSTTSQMTHTHLYASPGFYTVSLAATNIYGTAIYTQQSPISVYDIPTPIFEAQPIIGSVPLTVTFANSSTWATSYLWDFGDGTQSAVSDPTHVYDIAGDYTVTLTASNPMTSRVLSKPAVIQPYDFSVVSTEPSNGEIGIAVTQSISIAFNRLVDASTVSTKTFTVWGNQTGVYEGVYNITDNAVVFEGVRPFKVGEKIYVNLSHDLLSYDGLHLISHAWQFQVDVGYGQGAGNGVFTDSGQSIGSSVAMHVELGDLDGDGDLDAYVANGGDEEADRIWLNDGTGYFIDSGQRIGRSDTRSVALGDLDGDGDLDAYAAHWGSHPYRVNKVWLNDGTGTFSDSGQAFTSDLSMSVALGDLDGDGDLDVFVGNEARDGDEVWLNDGNGYFVRTIQNLGNYTTMGVTLGDVDNDGDLDAYTALFHGGGDRIWLNDGYGYFTDSGQILGNQWSLSGALADFDGDGDLDAFAANVSFDSENTVWLNDGLGTFIDSGQRLGTLNSYWVSPADFDGDGDLDVFVTSMIDQPNEFWLNDGTAHFSNSGQSLGMPTSYAVGAGDLDNDGDIDAFVSVQNGGEGDGNKVWFNNDAPIVGLQADNDGPTAWSNLTTLTAVVTRGNGITYSWHLGDGFVANGPNVSHRYTEVGTYTASVTASNSINLLTTTTIVTITDLPPMAIPTYGGLVTPTDGVTITVGEGAFGEAVLILYTPQPITETDIFDNASIFYDLSVQSVSTGLAAQLQQGYVYTITITYQKEDFPEDFNEVDLALYYWDGTTWIKESTSVVNVDANTVTATPNRFSLWAVLAPRASLPSVFLPVIFKP